MADLRAPVEVFGRAVHERDLKLASASFREYENRLFSLSIFGGDAARSAQYLFHVLWKLMMVVLPWRAGMEAHEESTTEQTLPNRWLPSRFGRRQALAAGSAHRFPAECEAADSSSVWYSGNHLPPHQENKAANDGRTAILVEASDYARYYGSHVPVPGPLRHAVMFQLRGLRAQVDEWRAAARHYTGWLDWRFTFPPYETRRYVGLPQAPRDSGSRRESIETARIPNPASFWASPEPSPTRTYRNEAARLMPERNVVRQSNASERAGTSQVEVCGHVMRMAVVGKLYQPRLPGGREGKRRRASVFNIPVRYWTVGEVGDHSSDGDRWVLVDDGLAGFDVYHSSGIDSLRSSDMLDKQLTKQTSHGRVVTDIVTARALRDMSSGVNRFRGNCCCPGRYLRFWRETATTDGRTRYTSGLMYLT